MIIRAILRLDSLRDQSKGNHICVLARRALLHPQRHAQRDRGQRQAARPFLVQVNSYIFLLLFIDKSVLSINVGASFPDKDRRTSVNFVSRQAAIGAVVAAALMLGANASPDTRPGMPSHSASTIGAQLTQSYQGTGAILAEMFQVCRDKILNETLDTFGEIAARLKQL
ncbi:MAG TPA: hypothetical protein VGC27_08445 [Rhizomicrobium sp.]